MSPGASRPICRSWHWISKVMSFGVLLNGLEIALHILGIRLTTLFAAAGVFALGAGRLRLVSSGDGEVPGHYHEALDRAFTAAVGPQRGRPVADAAREVILDEVLLPYDRLIGQFKDPDTLRGFTDRARLNRLREVPT